MMNEFTAKFTVPNFDTVGLIDCVLNMAATAITQINLADENDGPDLTTKDIVKMLRDMLKDLTAYQADTRYVVECQFVRAMVTMAKETDGSKSITVTPMVILEAPN